jgi:murein DD-endopeptidase MepM/ murein hydrolase activator NlpD
MPVESTATSTRVIPVRGGRIPDKGAGAWLADRPNGRLHAGIDIAAAAGRDVYAPEEGTVVEARADLQTHHTPPWSGYDPAIVVVRSVDGKRYHLLAHLERESLSVAKGEDVSAGARVGGIAGAKRHLHWEIRTQLLPRHGQKNVEISIEPGAWLRGEERSYAPLGIPRRCPRVLGPESPEPCRRKGTING